MTLMATLESTGVTSVMERMNRAVRSLLAVDKPPMRQGMIGAAGEYLAFTRRRYLKASAGDGTWKPLAFYTKLLRILRQRGLVASFGQRTIGKARIASLAQIAQTANLPILIETGKLFSSLRPGDPHGVFKFLTERVEVGTAVEYAHHHQRPTKPGFPPQRTILVYPDDAGRLAMKERIRQAALKCLTQAIHA